ncbi:hypothetical protein EHRUM1_03180 [Ehrlichia ruminantium]|nr:hypothetical protein EHRUM1_03180 [Ehrlichia ruminantium]
MMLNKFVKFLFFVSICIKYFLYNVYILYGSLNAYVYVCHALQGFSNSINIFTLKYQDLLFVTNECYCILIFCLIGGSIIYNLENVIACFR